MRVMNRKIRMLALILICILLAIAIIRLIVDIYLLFNNTNNPEIVKQTFTSVFFVIVVVFSYSGFKDL